MAQNDVLMTLIKVLREKRVKEKQQPLFTRTFAIKDEFFIAEFEVKREMGSFNWSIVNGVQIWNNELVLKEDL